MNNNLPPNPILTCDGPGYKRLASAALAWLQQNYETVNQSNVFPVPDGDTGTNMLLTMKAAYGEVAANASPDVSVIADKLAYGAIMGSRGNSGTILSQLFRGFAQSLSGKHTFDAGGLSAGLQMAVKMAYKAVQSPVEGTILTVAREVAEEVEAVARSTPDLRVIFERAVARARLSLARTPDLLPILKKAGVVDSGGQGFVFILEGMLRQLNGEALESVELTSPVGAKQARVSNQAGEAKAMSLADVLKSPDELGYGYDVQYILRGQGLDVEQIRKTIGGMGDSMVVAGDSSLVKVHIHVHDPGQPISYGASLGIIGDVVVENMQEQSEDYIAMRAASDPIEIIEVSPGDIALVAVAPGDGLRRVFQDLGVARVVSGGQTMNPSTEELLQAVQSLPTDKVIILPNNKNIILAAEQAAQLAQEGGKQRVVVVPSRSVPQGISALLSFVQDGEMDTVVQAMDNARANVVTGEVTTATRSVELDGVKVENGQVIGLVDGRLTTSANDTLAVVRTLLGQMSAQAREVITLYYGDTISEAEANGLVETLRADYPNQAFDVIYGGQPYYQYILSAE